MKIETGSALNESSHFCNIDVKANIKSNGARIKTVLKQRYSSPSPLQMSESPV